MTDEQVNALQLVVDRRNSWQQAALDLDAAINAALDAGVSVRVVAESAGVDHTTISRRRQQHLKRSEGKP